MTGRSRSNICAMMIRMRATVFAITILAVSVSADTVDRAYNIDAMASNQPHALRVAARLLDPPPDPPLYVIGDLAILETTQVQL